MPLWQLMNSCQMMMTWLILLTTQKPHTPKLPSTVRVCSLTPDTPIEMLLYCETATVTKTAHAIEDIHLNTQTIQREHVLPPSYKRSAGYTRR